MRARATRPLFAPVLVAAAMFCLSASPRAADGPPLIIKGGWVRAELAGAKTLKAFLIIENNSLQPQSIVLVEAVGFAGVEMQRTAPGSGASPALPVDQIDVPMFGKRVLEPYGEYLLLTGAKRVYRAGDTIAITFQLADGKQQTVTLPVRRDPEN
jgi:copper(I)-binding protein